jgi:phage terminase small subunit
VKGLSNKQRVFIEYYLQSWNASEAARLAGYKGKANVVGPRLLANVSIAAAIQARIEELKISADEVLLRLAEHARGDMADFVDPQTLTIDFDTAAQKNKMRLVKKVKVVTRKEPSRDGDTVDTIEAVEFELYDAQAALALLGRHHKLFTDKVETTKAEDPVEEQFREDILSRLSRLAPGGDAAAVPGGSDSTAT